MIAPTLGLVLALAAPLAALGSTAVDPMTALALDAQELDLLGRQIGDLRALVELELKPEGRPKLQLMLAELYLARARKHRFVQVERQRLTEQGLELPAPALDHQTAAEVDESRAAEVLEATGREESTTLDIRRTVLWSLAELVEQRGDLTRAVGLLDRLATIAEEPCLEARALGRIGRILVRLNERAQLEQAQRRYARAQSLCASVEHVLGVAQTHERLGNEASALDAYARVMAYPPDAEGAADAQRYALVAIARLLADASAFDEAAAYLDGLGPPARRVWYRLGRSYLHRRRPGDALRAMRLAAEQSPSPDHRARAVAGIVEAAVKAGEPEGIAAAVEQLESRWRWIDELSPSARATTRLGWARAVRRAVEHIGEAQAAWPVSAAESVFAVYLERFPDDEFRPWARYIRGSFGARRAGPDTPCASHRRDAEDFAAAFEGLLSDDRPVAEQSAREAVRSYSACRPAPADGSQRPATAITDEALESFAEGALRRLEAPEAVGEVEVHLGQVHFAHRNDDDALALFVSAAERAGEHRPEAVRGWGRVLVATARWAELEEFARRMASDPMLPDDLRRRLGGLAPEAAFSHARAVEGAPRAERLIAAVDRYPDVPDAAQALLEAGLLLVEAGDAGEAHAVLTRVVASYGETDAGRRATLSLARFLEARGRTRDAVERYTSFLTDPPQAGVDPADVDSLRRKAAFYWTALGEPANAVAIRLQGEPPTVVSRAMVEAALAELEVGHLQTARALVEAAGESVPDDARGAARMIGSCRRDALLSGRRIRRARRADPLTRAAVARCVALQLEHAAAHLPPPSKQPINDLNRQLRARYRLETTALDLVALRDPQTGARARLAMAGVAATLAETLDRVAEVDAKRAGDLPGRAREEAQALWRAAYDVSRSLGVDGCLSRQVERLAARLAPASRPQAPSDGLEPDSAMLETDEVDPTEASEVVEPRPRTDGPTPEASQGQSVD